MSLSRVLSDLKLLSLTLRCEHLGMQLQNKKQ